MPTNSLLLSGEKDDRMSMREINHIFKNLAGVKKLKTYPLADDENYLIRYKDQWTNDIEAFLHKSAP